MEMIKEQCSTCGQFLSKNRIEKHKIKCVPRYCINCNKQLFGENKRIRFCSRECIKQYNIKNNDYEKYKIKKCEHCGKEFTSETEIQKFCSKSCSAKISNKSINRNRKISNKKTSETLKNFYKDDINKEFIKKLQAGQIHLLPILFS